jgi:hypothetical protein
MTTEAVHCGLNPSYKPELGAPHHPKYIAYVIAPVRAFSAVGGPQLRAVAAAQPAANLAVPVKGSLRTLGWRTHASQHLERAYPLPGWLLFDFWDKEHYAIVEPEP